MKRIALGCLLLVGVMPIAFGSASAGCDQDFYKTLRYNKQYTFRDEFNANSSDKWMWNWDMDYSEQYDYNQSSSFPEFDWTNEIIAADYKVPAHNTMSIIKAKSAYPILAVPTSRSYDNLLLKYTITYSTDEAGNHKYTHTECGHYEISRCGDGVVDSSYGEVCDPGDSSHAGWGNGGCNNSCQPVTAAAPVCNSSYNGQRLSSLTEGNHLCTEGTYSDFVYSESTHKWTWKCGNVAGTKVDCSATKPYCGDGVKDTGETCDPADSNHAGWGNGGCSATCEPITVAGPVCNSSYNGQRLTSLVAGNHLCTEGTYSDFVYSESTHKWTWKCKNTLGSGTDCSATKPYCGDGVKDAGETCDPADSNHTGWGNGGCSATCEPITISGPACNSSYNGQRLTSLVAGNHLCTEGTYSDFVYSESTHKWTWKCKNTLGSGTDCSATKPYCGDGVKDAGETCDPADSSHTGWGDLGCNNACEPITTPNGCDETFYDKLRFGHQYTFYDEFNAGSTDKWLRSWVMEYSEQYDYNKSPSFPTFAWTTNLVNNNYKVPANTTMRVLQATSTYPILAVPATRAYDNLFIKYTLTSSTDAAGNSKHAHSECAYYEITRCGDGVLDTDYDEICDPADPSHTGWGNGGCDAECKPVTAANGTPKIEKTLKDKKQVKEIGEILTWEVKVWAEGGDVTDFQIEDIVPAALKYKGYTVKSNTDNLTVNNPTGPVMSGEDSVYTWDVKGTLKSGNGHELVIEVTTEVVKMPKSNDDYRNVACVIKDNKKDCDDDKPEPSKGYLVPDKTLIEPKEIKNTGDVVKWSLKVTAKGGDVTDVVITDKLPPVLAYKGFEVNHSGGLDISNYPTSSTFQSGGETWTKIVRNAKGTLTENDYVEIILTTYAKEMPSKDYNNVLCARPEGVDPNDEDCDDEPVPSPDLRIKKTFTDGSKTKVVAIGDEIGYKITFGNNGTASATITSIKDFLPKNVQYVSSKIFMVAGVNSQDSVDGVSIDIYGGITLAPKAEGYIILTGKILSEFTGSTQNLACIYLNDEKIECDDAIHTFTDKLMCTKPDITTTSFTKTGGSTDVVCKTFPTGEKADSIELDCGNGTIYTGSNVASLSGVCTYPENNSSSSISYTVECKVNNEDINDCKGTITVPGQTTPPSTCFVAGTKVVMADGTEKNIEDVKIGEKIMGENGVNTVLGYDRPVLGERHLWSINGGEYFVSDEHPFKTTEGWKSFNPEMTKLEIDLNTTELIVGDELITKNGLEIVETVAYMDADYDTPLYNFVLDGDHTYYANGYLVHNKGGEDPYCKAPVLKSDVFTCESTDKVYAIGIDCDHVVGKVDIDKEKNTGGGRDILSVSASCSQNGKVQCYVKKNSTSSWETKTSGCGWEPTTPPGPSCFPAGTKVEMADGTFKNIEEIEKGDIVLSYNTDTNTNEGNVVNQKFVHKNSIHEMYELTINGKVLKVTDAHRFYVIKGDHSNNYEWIEAKNLKIGDILLMSDGSYVKIENIIHYPNIETVYNFEVENNHNYFVAEGYLVHNKKGPNPPTPPDPVLYDSAACFNVNTNNISIEQGEILPFFWNISNLENNKDVFTVLGDGDYGDDVFEVQKNVINDYQNEKCDDEGAIALNSMLCDFKIKDGNSKVVYEGQFPCLRAVKGGTDYVSEYKMLDAWMKYGKNKYKGDGKYKFFWSFSNKDRSYALRSNLNYILDFGIKDKNLNTINTFGEYKLSLTKIEYLQCRDEKWTFWAPEITTCENDFALTNSYTVQKTPSGNLKASTTELDKYLYMDGKTALKASELLKATIAESDYVQNDAVNKAMNNFVSKYQKLAVSVENGMKKVPGKSIYFIEGDKVIKDGAFTKATTFVQTDPTKKITIEGDIKNLNIMVLTRGTIVFKDTNTCNPTGTQSRQTVKGIFYAEKGLERSGVLKNTKEHINDSRRCVEGGLTIKGVLIGKGFDGLMKASRSNLNNWFGSSQKKSIVMNGASVLIEYSPSVFTKGSMPPGAEDFTTALSIYKN